MLEPKLFPLKIVLHAINSLEYDGFSGRHARTSCWLSLCKVGILSRLIRGAATVVCQFGGGGVAIVLEIILFSRTFELDFVSSSVDKV